MRCEYCGRKLRPSEGKGCSGCARKIQEMLKQASEAHYQAHAESHGHLSSNPNDRQTL